MSYRYIGKFTGTNGISKIFTVPKNKIQFDRVIICNKTMARKQWAAAVKEYPLLGFTRPVETYYAEGAKVTRNEPQGVQEEGEYDITFFKIHVLECSERADGQ